MVGTNYGLIIMTSSLRVVWIMALSKLALSLDHFCDIHGVLFLAKQESNCTHSHTRTCTNTSTARRVPHHGHAMSCHVMHHQTTIDAPHKTHYNVNACTKACTHAHTNKRTHTCTRACTRTHRGPPTRVHARINLHWQPGDEHPGHERLHHIFQDLQVFPNQSRIRCVMKHSMAQSIKRRYLQNVPRMNQLFRTLGNASSDIVMFGIMFSIVYFGFSMAFYVGYTAC